LEASGVGIKVCATFPPMMAACEAEMAAWRWCSYMHQGSFILVQTLAKFFPSSSPNVGRQIVPGHKKEVQVVLLQIVEMVRAENVKQGREENNRH